MEYGVNKQVVSDIRKNHIFRNILCLLIEKAVARMHKVAHEHKYEASKIRQFICEAVMKWYIQQC
jgi:hypothetical protein